MSTFDPAAFVRQAQAGELTVHDLIAGYLEWSFSEDQRLVLEDRIRGHGYDPKLMVQDTEALLKEEKRLGGVLQTYSNALRWPISVDMLEKDKMNDTHRKSVTDRQAIRKELTRRGVSYS